MSNRQNPAAAPRNDGLRVLVVEDEPLIRWALAETLTDAGYTAIEAGDGATAMRAVAADEIDVILLDFVLPDSNDLGLLETLRRLAPSAPVIMITAYGTADLNATALRLGAHRVLNKPLDMPDIPALVHAAHGCRVM